MQKKAKALVIVARTIVRTSSIPASNPIVLTEESLSPERPWFRITTIRVGTSVAIGVANSGIKVNDGNLLGYQNGLNCAYVDYAEPAPSTLRACGIVYSGKVVPASRLNPGDVIDIKLDFTAKRIHFWRNQEYLSAINANFNEGDVYPAVSISFDSEVIIANDSMPDFINSVGTAAPKKTVKMMNNTKLWEWNSARPEGIVLSGTDNLIATRNETKGVKNPVLFAATPFTTSNPWFRVIIRKLGHWIAIGAAEIKYPLSGGKVLGEEILYFNTGYLDQAGKNIKRITTNQAKSNTFLQKLEVGETFDIKFTPKCIFFWKNLSYLGCANIPKPGTTVYPVVQLSADTEVELVASGKMPDLQPM